MYYCPSRKLSDTLNDLVTISNTGGDIYKYLTRKLKNQNEEVEAEEKKSIETLLIFSQIYTVVLLIGPLFLTIMSSILSLVSFGSGSGGGDASGAQTIIMMLMGLPFAYVGFMFMVYYTKPLYTRLKPMKQKER
jgi:archaellum biogenesis protein FlaJ (TadC family)